MVDYIEYWRIFSSDSKWWGTFEPVSENVFFFITLILFYFLNYHTNKFNNSKSQISILKSKKIDELNSKFVKSTRLMTYFNHNININLTIIGSKNITNYAII